MPTAPDADGKFLTSQQSKLETNRSALDQHCQEVTQYVLPMLAEFGLRESNNQQRGQKKTEKLMESTAPLALQRYASAVEGFLVPRGERYQKLKTSDKNLNKQARVKKYFDEANEILFDCRYDPRGGFSSQINEVLQGVGSVGTTATFVNGAVRQKNGGGFSAGTTYSVVTLTQIWGSQGITGQWDKAHRRFPYTARNIVAEFGDECPEEIRRCAEKEPEKEFTLLHCVHPNTERKRNALGPDGMAFKSMYVWPEKNAVISRGGYGTLRYAIARGTKGPGEHYGRSAGMTVLAEIKTINEMRRTLLRAQHLNLAPPTLLHSEHGASLDLRPQAKNYGMVTAEGDPLAIPFMSGSQFPASEREMERIRNVINDAFLITLFQILVERNPGETATLTLQKAKEQAIILSPLIGKLQEEYLGGLTESEIDILSELGWLPEMPPELIEAQGEYSITYQSDMMRALQSGDILGYRGWIEDASPMANINPELLEIVDHEGILRDNAEKRGIPQHRIRTEKQMQELRQRNAQAKQQAAAMPAMQQAADLSKTQAEAESMRTIQ